MQFLGSLVFNVLMWLWMLVFAFTYCVVTPFMPFRARFWLAGVMTRVIFFKLKWLCGLTYTVEGRENLPAGANVIFMKHSSTWETFAIMILFPPLVWVMKREILFIPFVGWGCVLARCIAIDRKAGASAVNQVLKQGKDRMERLGASVMVFPEGTRMAPGETRRYGSSGTLLAAQQGCKIVPVAHNAGYFWPRRGVLKKRGVIRVVIGPPIEAAGRDARQVNDEVQAWIERHVEDPRARPAATR
ncbi:MAG TPA: lysophospholipid acyltransferase family protein [Steroidobacteraceae bacterium]|nr:lysophospholipid acyltransferase family protein [Steroidobacteraceae bacterium]